MNQQQTERPSPLQPSPEPAALVPVAGETQKVCASPRDSESTDAAVLGYN